MKFSYNIDIIWLILIDFDIWTFVQGMGHSSHPDEMGAVQLFFEEILK